MKNMFIILTMFIFMPFIAFSQDKYPEQQQFTNANGMPIILNTTNNTNLLQTEFIRGWQWGGNPLSQIL